MRSRTHAALNAPYLKLLRTGRPWVHAKWAMTLDGKIATRTGDSKWISGEESRRRVHELRGRMDAIIVGRGTVVADDPLLTARPAGPRVPVRVVLSASGELPNRRLLRFTAHEVPVIVFTAAGTAHKLVDWATDGAEVVELNDTALSLDAVLVELGRRRFTNVLVEGGAGLLGTVLDGAADEFHIFIAPKLIGGNAALSPIGGIGSAVLADALALKRVTFVASGEDIYVHGFMHKRSGARQQPAHTVGYGSLGTACEDIRGSRVAYSRSATTRVVRRCRPALGLHVAPPAPGAGHPRVARGPRFARRHAHRRRQVALLPGARRRPRRADGRRVAAHRADEGPGGRPDSHRRARRPAR